MTLQTSGSISLNEIHVEAGGTSGTTASINDADIRGIAANIPSGHSPMPFSFWYGAPFSVGSWPQTSGVNWPVIPFVSQTVGSGGSASAYLSFEFKHDTSNNRIEMKKSEIKNGTTSGVSTNYVTYTGDVLDSSNSTGKFEVAINWSAVENNNAAPGEHTATFIQADDAGGGSHTNYISSSETGWEQLTSSFGTAWKWGVSTDDDANTSTLELDFTIYIRVLKEGIYFPFATGYVNSGSKSVDISAKNGDTPGFP